MTGNEYPKIDTLYDRDKNRLVMIEKIRRPEFEIIKKWTITEKINGTNSRISLFGDGGIEYGGKTDEAEIPSELLEYLKKTFTLEKMKSAFWIDPAKIPQLVTIYGESYGPKLAHGSKLYRNDISFRLFDCIVDKWWLERPNLEDVANKLEIKCVPTLGVIEFLPISIENIENLFQNNRNKLVAIEEEGYADMIPEGIVAKTEPLLFNRKGERVMWKLKIKDFRKISKK